LAIKFAKLADKKKADDIIILNLKKITFITDYFIVATGMNKKHNQAIAMDLIEQAKALGVAKLGLQGYEEGNWVLVDFGWVVIHLLNEQLREFYNLESIWGGATKINWKKK